MGPEVQRAHSWEGAYEQALEELFQDTDHISLDDIIEVAFQKGIVDRLAPLDEEVKRLRQEQHRRVWDGSREDSALYARLYYAVEESRESVADTMDHSWANAAWLAFNKIMSRESLRERVFGTALDANESVAQFLNALRERVKEEYEEKKGRLSLEIIPSGTKAMFHGIALTVDCHNPDGTLRVTADDEEGHRALYKFNGGKGLTPEMFLSKDFVIQK
jgi:hypothetical protein